MSRSQIIPVVALTFALIFVFAAPRQMSGQENKTPYPNVAPLDQYLMDRDAEIALARSAAPESISRDATVLFLGRHGYETAVEGKNGFVCLVERSWTSPFDDPGFWNPRGRAPLCLNQFAARSILPITLKRTDAVLAGKSKAQIEEWTKTAFANKELPTTLEPGAMSYMMSKDAYLSDDGSHNLAHLMFYVPLMDKANWGADLPHSPVYELQHGPPQPFVVLIVPTGKWSDGSSAALPR